MNFHATVFKDPLLVRILKGVPSLKYKFPSPNNHMQEQLIQLFHLNELAVISNVYPSLIKQSYLSNYVIAYVDCARSLVREAFHFEITGWICWILTNKKNLQLSSGKFTFRPLHSEHQVLLPSITTLISLPTSLLQLPKKKKLVPKRKKQKNKKSFKENIIGKQTEARGETHIVTAQSKPRISGGVKQHTLIRWRRQRLTSDLVNGVTRRINETQFTTWQARMFLGHKKIDRDLWIRAGNRNWCFHGVSHVVVTNLQKQGIHLNPRAW